MSNMSYCRFENTSGDLADCVDNMELTEKTLSNTEYDARDELIGLCVDIATGYGHEIGREAVECEK